MTFVEPSDGVFHHEDLVAGSQATYGSRLVTRDEIIAFATAFDPQPMHLDDEAAKQSVVGGLCASGWHTCAIMMRMLFDNFLCRSTSLGSPGLDEVKWLKPLRPGTRLSIRISVLETRLLQSRPDVGMPKMLYELLDEAGTPILTAATNQLMLRRHPGPAVPPAERKPSRPNTPAASLWDLPLPPPVQSRGNYFEDLAVGDIRSLGSHLFDRDEIIAFARQFDPQPFHLDEDAGRRSLFGGLCASGWHTAAYFIRHMVLARQAEESALRAAGTPLAAWGPSPGFRNLSWPKPVLVGDTIEYRNTVVELRPLRSRPERGLVISQAEGRNQRGETVFRVIGQMFVDRRPGAAAAG